MRIGGHEAIYTPYQAPKMELFVEIFNGYFRKNLHLMFERVLNTPLHHTSNQKENAKNTNNPRKVAHTKITTKTSAMKVVFTEGGDKI